MQILPAWKMKAAKLDGRPPLQFPSRKKRMQITALVALLNADVTTLWLTYMAMQMCLIGWMNLRKVHPWTEIILVASCVRQLNY